MAQDQLYVIDTQGLSYHYGENDLRQNVLDRVSLQVKSGEFVILAGPSGSGKSTLLSLLGGLRRNQGCDKLLIVGKDLKNAEERTLIEARRSIGYVFQQHNLLNFLTARQNVEMTLEMFPTFSSLERKELAWQILSLAGLQNDIDKFPAQLSVGQRQRVAISRGLAHRPKLILADEPTASLDGKSGLKMIEMFHQMVKTLGSSALVVTHDERIFNYADRILRIEDGVVIE